MTRAEIEQSWPGYLADRRLPPGFESQESVTRRALDSLNDLHRRLGGRGEVLVVAHGGVIRHLERHAGLEPRPIPNLGGRWFDVHEDGVAAGEALVLVDHERLSVPEGL